MKNKYKTMIYPFDVESAPLLRHNKLLDKYYITQAVSPSGWGFDNKDAGDADKGGYIGITVDNDFDRALENCDAVFFNNPSREVDLNKVIYPKMIKAAQKSKHIICTMEIENKFINKISHICHENSKNFEYFTKKFNENISPPTDEIYEVDSPIIFVAGLAERTNKFEVQLNLRKYLKEMGYKVSQIGTRHYCELMGFHSFPKFMYNNCITESEKVTLFNYYINNISIAEKPDVIIIGIPGGTVPFNHTFTNKFGILAYEVSQAVLPDVAILSVPYGDIPENYFESISKSHKYKFGYSIDCYSIANSSLNAAASRLAKSLQYITMDFDFINEKIKMYSSSKIPIYNVFNKDDSEKMSKLLIAKLQEYGETIIV